jgi:hypothetical protein
VRADFALAQCQGTSFMDTQCQGAYALKEFSSQTLSSRIDRNTEFKFLQLEGEIDKDVIKNIENAKNYLNESASKKLQAI